MTQDIDYRTIAVFIPNWIGDVVMATPALRALREKYSGSDTRIIGIMRPHLIGLLAGTGFLDETWAFKPKSENPDERARAISNRMRKEGVDLAVMLTHSLRPAVMSFKAKVPHRIGYAANGRTPLLTHKTYFSRQGRRRVPFPCVDMYLRIVELIGLHSPSRKMELSVDPSDCPKADAIYTQLGLRSDKTVLLNGGGAHGPAKRLPEDVLIDLARRIIDEQDRDILLLCGPSERDMARDLVAKIDRKNAASMADQELTWNIVKACVAKGSLMITTDSGPRHIAAALDVPVITLLGPTVSAWIANPTVVGSEISLDSDELDCLGCAERTCPRDHHRCMRELPIDEILETAKSFQ